jgi:potassium-dependent mechanosensitive channel
MPPEITESLQAINYVWSYRIINLGETEVSVGNLILAIVLLLVATRLSRAVANFLNQKLVIPFIPSKSNQNTYHTLLFYVCLVTFVTLSLHMAGIPLTAFTFVGGALAIGVGFGSQNIVNNFISGIIILVEQPVRVGDIVQIDGLSGRVLSIGTRSTKIRNVEGKINIIPNSYFLEKNVLNWSFDTPIVRDSVEFGVAYGSDVYKVEHVCMDILLNTAGVEQDPIPLVLFNNFGDSTLNFTLTFWVNLDAISSLAKLKSDIRFKIDDKFKEHGITMAFPQRDTHLMQEKPLEIKILS